MHNKPIPYIQRAADW